MRYVIYTTEYNTRMYFMEHVGEGFKISMDIEKAKTYDDPIQARIAANNLTATTGLNAEVTRK
jgi:hypothetical protein